MSSTISERKFEIAGKKFKVMCESYASANEVAEDCTRRKITYSSFDDMKERHLDSRGDDWYGVKKYEEAIEFLKTGYQPTVDKLKEKLKASRMGNGKRITFRNNVVGANPIVPLALMGVPNCMVDMQMKPIKCKVIDVYYDSAMEFRYSSKEILEAGQKLLGVILDLESQGYRFNVYAIQGYSGRESADILKVKVKSSNQPIDLKRISFPLTHPAFFRVIGFDWYSKTPKGTYRSGYGHSIQSEFGDKMNEFAKKVFGDNAVYISGKQIASKGKDADKYLMEELTNVGKGKK